jgi:O-succinylbenzoic acid--CoA ligase
VRLPLTHVGGLSIVLRSAIGATTGAACTSAGRPRPCCAGLDDATIVSLVPTTLARLLDAGLREPPALRWALLGGAPIPPPLLDRAGRPRRARRADVRHDRGVLAGRHERRSAVLHRVTVDPATASCLSPGRPWRPRRSGRRRLHTGDVGRIGRGGVLSVTGRLAETIISGGENVAPAEVEAALESHPAVLEAAVHGRPDPQWGEAVVATVVLRDGREATEAELRAHAAAHLARFKVPKAVTVRAGPLPRTATGKLLRRAL